jgi:hypothetical protein
MGDDPYPMRKVHQAHTIRDGAFVSLGYRMIHIGKTVKSGLGTDLDLLDVPLAAVRASCLPGESHLAAIPALTRFESWLIRW